MRVSVLAAGVAVILPCIHAWAGPDANRSERRKTRADAPASASATTPPGPSGQIAGSQASATTAPSGTGNAATAATGLLQPPTPWLGVGIGSGFRGVRLIEVIDGTPADSAGLVPGDEILTIAGTAVATPSDLIATVTARKVGDAVPLAYLRDGRVHSIQVRLDRKLTDEEILERRLLDEPAPLFDLPVVSGTAGGRLADLVGDVVVLEFFSTWCNVCASTHRALSAFADRHIDDGVTVLAIANEPVQSLAAWVRTHGYSFTVLSDRRGAASDAYRTAGRVPVIVVIDRQGNIIYAGMGGESNVDRALFTAERLVQRRPRF